MLRIRSSVGIAALAAAVSICSCTGSGQTTPRSPVEQVRKEGPSSTDPEVVGRWLLAELISTGADTARAREARQRLDQLRGKGLMASFARGLDREVHGHPKQATEAYFEVVAAAKDSPDPLAPLAAWYATNRILRTGNSSGALWKRFKSLVEESIAHPGSLGWRSRGELVELWGHEAYREARKDLLDSLAKMHGCHKQVRLAGPFGRGVASDRWTSFDAEKPGRWPSQFEPDPHRDGVVPRVLETESHGCEVSAKDPQERGVFYVETFIDLKGPQDVLIAVQGSRAILVDDVVVLERDPRQWGIWPTFGTALHLGAGRHRLVARVENASTSVRLMRRDGTPLDATASVDDGSPYATIPPRVLSDPNVLNRYIRRDGVKQPADDVTTFTAAYLAHVEGQDDVGSVLMEPMVRELKQAGPVALAQQAFLVAEDPAFPEGAARDLARVLHETVIEKDPGIWRSAQWVTVDAAGKKGLPAAARDLRELFARYTDVPDIGSHLARVYQELGWVAEREQLIRTLAERFPDDEEILGELLEVHEGLGEHEAADAIAKRLRAMDPDSELELDRALRRHDYEKALQELRRLAALRPDRKAITDRIEQVMRQAGLSDESFEELERAIEKQPRSASPRLALADARLARGDHDALRVAIVEAIQQGADTSDLESALELLEARTELAPYRVDGRQVIDEFEKTGSHMDAAAVRVLDYGVTWVHADGSSRMLEHEIIRVQSQEAIGKMAEQRIPRALVLRVRVIKKDGTVLEPEFVADKPTLTMPHLEVGDYIETEWITSMRGDGRDGAAYLGPHWFFREADIGYWRSELVVISPKDRPLTIETSGPVPAPEVTDRGFVVVRRWRVDKSPAAVIEPGTVPIRELLPNIRVGWGISLDWRLRNLVDQFEDVSIPDPRLRRIANQIVKDLPASKQEERARRLYRWILANIERGDEHDGRRIVVGRSGDLGFGFLYLARLIGLKANVTVVRNALVQPPNGPISEAETFDNFVVRLDIPKGEKWLTMRDRFTPFGYLPAQLRGQPGYVLVEGTPKVTTSATGGFDGVVHEAKGKMRPNGSAAFALTRRFVGKYAIALREGIEQLPEARLRDAVESQLLAQDLPGASLVNVTVRDRDDLDKPLTLQMNVEIPDFARRSGGELVLDPPFSAKIAEIAALPERRTTLLISEASRVEVRLRVTLPDNATVVTPLAPRELHNEGRSVIVNDRVEGRDLVIDRVFDIPAARITPEAYGAFHKFAREADEATHREIRIRVQ